MTDVVAFLRDRLDEDEALAREACDRESGEWFMGDKWNVYQQKEVTPYEYSDTEELVVYGNMKAQSEHIARHHPARVLREVKAKRAIVALHAAMEIECSDVAGDPWAGTVCSACEGGEDWPCTTLRHVAAVYADRPDYDPAWSVE